MSDGDSHIRDRILELLADRAVQGLSEPEARELDQLLAAAPEFRRESMDLAAAAGYLAMAAGESGGDQTNPLSIAVEPMPAALREKIVAAAMQRLREAQQPHTPGREAGLRPASPEPQPQRPYLGTPGRQGATPPPRERSAWMGYTGWAAAATLLAVAAGGWLMGRTGEPGPTPPAPQAELLRERLLTEHGEGVVRAAWTSHADGSAQPGDVVWHGGKQEGYIRVASLPVNDPREARYRVWIIDLSRESPMDGGAFDVSGPGETVVPIRPAAKVEAAAAFTVTLERVGEERGGERLLVAEVGP